MFIQTERTPNPNALKFFPGEGVMPEGTAFFSTPEEASACPLARQLLEIEGVTDVFLGSDFLSVTKKEEAAWQVLRPLIFASLVDHFLGGRPLFTSAPAPRQERASSHREDDPIVHEIRELLDGRIRPAVRQDGGDIVFDRFEEGVVYVQLQGACVGCPSSQATLKSGIENTLRHYIPEVREVRAV
jgi:Fe-S cluster biogenesis protein NfuA